MTEKTNPKCAVCGKPAEPWQRNTDGTYLHDGCAAQLAASPNIHPPAVP